MGLNPFFIRSVVGIYAMSQARLAREVLIPSSSGLWLEFTAFVKCGYMRGLNPFFIRSVVGIVDGAKVGMTKAGLNPFFIRSVVGIRLAGQLDRSGLVLIPSSSGLWLESTAR